MTYFQGVFCFCFFLFVFFLFSFSIKNMVSQSTSSILFLIFFYYVTYTSEKVKGFQHRDSTFVCIALAVLEN